MVVDCWNSTKIKGIVSYRIVQKLKRLKQEIKTWVNVNSKKEECINDILLEIDFLERNEKDSILFAADRDKRNTLKSDLANRLQMEATSWKQKSMENG